MTGKIQVRLVNVEFLRAGPPQNQLLSPLTQYLAVCGDAGAGVVTVPYEHATFERKLKELRYETGDPDDRLAMLHDVGVDMGRILGAVPGLPGGLAIDPNLEGLLVHLRLTLSASELALLPFEFAKVPGGPNATTESWLAIQTRPPVAITRHIRSVSPEGVVWPHRPRVLFVAGDPGVLPFREHRDALVEAIEPFRHPQHDEPTQSRNGGREQFGDLLTILVNPTLTDIFRECHEARYTHVHLLAHGDFDDAARASYGLVLRGSQTESDIVSGERLSSALTSIDEGRIHRPTVVTVASCDSANVGSVVRPGASFAHALHQGGVPLVVASQFPLSIEGSVPLVGTLYRGLLWGGHPLLLVQQIRAELHARHTSRWHDWASLVVYEALPQAMAEQLENAQYFQAKRAVDAALERIDLRVRESGERLDEAALARLDHATARAIEHLPVHGRFGAECLGLRASAHKRLAHAAFALAGDTPPGVDRGMDSCELLEQAWLDYDRALRGLVVNDGRTLQRVATLHWLAVQVEALSVVLAKPSVEGRWEAAKLWAEMYLDHADSEERAWAHGSLAELWLLRLARKDVEGDTTRAREIGERVLHHAAELARRNPARESFAITSTRRQFDCYASWWADPRFERALAAHGVVRGGSWARPGGLLELAARVIELLQPRRTHARSGPQESAGRSGHAATSAAAGPGTTAASAAPVSAPAPAALSSQKRPRAKGKKRDGLFFDIEMLPAGHGDCLWIEYGDARATHRWLVDGGTQASASALLERIESLPENDRHFELLVLSHIDSDHIGGVLPLLKAVGNGLTFGDVWFNGWQHLSGRLGAKQGEMFSSAIRDLHLPWNAWRHGEAIVVEGDELPRHTLPGGMTLTLLSPTPTQLSKLAPAWMQELRKAGLVPGSHVDYSRFLKQAPSISTDVDALADAPFAGDSAPANGSSIALLVQFAKASALLGADAHDPVLAAGVRRLNRQRGVERLQLDALKVSHHGSRNNLSREFLDLVDCKRYCVSTNGDHFRHPDREAIGRIIKYGGKRPELHFNYRTRYNEVWQRPDLQERYAYSARYPQSDRGGASVSLLGERR